MVAKKSTDTFFQMRQTSTWKTSSRLGRSVSPIGDNQSANDLGLSEYRIRSVVREELAAAQIEITELRSALANALTRLAAIESRSTGQGAPNPLFGSTAPVLDFARELCAEIFPGPVSLELACAPDDPSAQWYVFHVSCKAGLQECVTREIQFGLRLHDAFPKEAGDIRLAVSTL